MRPRALACVAVLGAAAALAGGAAAAADTTPPAYSCTPGAADGQWHIDNVSFACTASDAGSGLADPGAAVFVLRTSVPYISANADAATDSRLLCDNAGNCVTAGPIRGNKIDRYRPAIMCANNLITTDQLQRWQSENVSVPCTISDLGSGLVDPTQAVFETTGVPLGVETYSARARTPLVCDVAGNCSYTLTDDRFKIDRRPPTVSCDGSPDGEWHAANVRFTCTADDAGSGLLFGADHVFTVSTSVGPGADDANAYTPAHGVPDLVALPDPTVFVLLPDHVTTAAPIGPNKIDKKAPGGSIRCDGVSCSSTRSYPGGVQISFATSDGSGSGVAGVYYTTDGSDPGPDNGTLYTGIPFSVFATTTIRYRAVDSVGNLQGATGNPPSRLIQVT